MNRLLCSTITLSGLIALSGTGAFAQSVISAHSGLIHYVEGRVLLDGKPVEVKVSTFPEVKANMELRTEDGRAEVLLNPGVFLRLSENSAIRMVSNKLSDSQVEFLAGSAMIEASSELAQKENSVAILYKGASVHLRKSGIYRFNSDPAQLRVYSGEAEVTGESNSLTVKSSHLVALDSLVAVEKFDAKDGDALSRWSERRGEYISMANVSAAKYVNDSGSGISSNGWFYNPYFGMFTYIPMNGMFYSPYGYPYYSPGRVYQVYQYPGSYAGSRSGYGTGAAVANTGFSNPSAAMARRASAPVARAVNTNGAFGGSGASLHAPPGGASAGGARMGGVSAGGGRSR
jgi:FecR protein